MQMAYGLQFGAWLILYMALFSFVKIRFPDSTPGKLLATIA